MLRILVITLLTAVPLQDRKEEVVFYLPFEKGKTCRVWQGNDQGPSHSDDFNKYAWDFSMRVGTPVHAAAGGIVTAIKEDTEGPTGNGGDNNYVKIRHADGTEGQYHHIKKDGAVVEKGQTVMRGDLIAYSGNTGASDAPHLHFAVHKGGPSIQVKFEDVPDDGVPEKGDRVKSGNEPVRSPYEEKMIRINLALFDIAREADCTELLDERMAAMEAFGKDKTKQVEATLQVRADDIIETWKSVVPDRKARLKELMEKESLNVSELKEAVWIVSLDEKGYREERKALKERPNYAIARKVQAKAISRRKEMVKIFTREMDIRKKIQEGDKKENYDGVVRSWEKFIKKHDDWDVTSKLRTHVAGLKKK